MMFAARLTWRSEAQSPHDAPETICPLDLYGVRPFVFHAPQR
jgi:hypothetical protein